MSTAWVDAYQANELPAFYTVIETQVALHPAIAFDCHNAGHSAGKVVLADELIERVLRVTLDSPDPCLGGFGHGALDAFGTVPRDDREIRTVARMCLASGDMRDSCADGMGHAAWESTRHDAGKASSWCTKLSPMSATATVRASRGSSCRRSR